MTDRITSQRIVSMGGLNTLNNYLTLSDASPGSAVKLQNFESSLSGGYRRISGFRPLDADYAEIAPDDTEGRVLGIWGFYNTSTQDNMYIAARKTKDADTYKFYHYQATTGWVEMTTGIVQDFTSLDGLTVTKVRAEIFNFGDKNQIIFVDGVNHPVIYDGTSWYELSSSGTGGSSSPGGDQLINHPSVVTSFKNYILLSGDVDYPAVISYSAPLDSLTWTAAAGSGQVTYGYDVVNIKPFRDECYIFGKTNLKKLIPDATSTFLMKDVTNDLGCVARDSILELGGSLIFMSTDGIRPIAGTDKINDVELGLLSGAIQDLIDDVSTTFNFDDLNAVVIRTKTQFRYFFADENYEVTESAGLIGSIRSGVDQRWEFSTIQGIRASCCWSGIVDTREVVLHGDYDGCVYQQERGNSFNNEIITAIYTTPYLDMGDTEVRKTMRNINIFLKNEGFSTLNVAMKFDWGLPGVIAPSNYSSSIAGGVLYDAPTSIYGDPSTTYGGSANNLIQLNIQGSCRSVQYTISSNIISPAYTIHGFVHEFTPDGRQ